MFDSFKDYIEKRTVEEIMEDYSEQHDEWEALENTENKKED